MDQSQQQSASARIQGFASLGLLCCAVGVLGLMLYSEIFPRKSATAEDPPPEPVANWEALSADGRRFGKEGSPVKVLVFTDFECPACEWFERSTLAPFLAAHPDEVQVIVRHWPLEYHKHAMGAAIAAECAGAQGAFRAVYEEYFRHQDSLGLREARSVAMSAKVPDLDAFAECVIERRPEALIAKDIEAARGSGAKGTPAVVVNGLLYSVPPDRMQLEAILAQSGSDPR